MSQGFGREVRKRNFSCGSEIGFGTGPVSQ